MCHFKCHFDKIHTDSVHLNYGVLTRYMKYTHYNQVYIIILYRLQTVNLFCTHDFKIQLIIVPYIGKRY